MVCNLTIGKPAYAEHEATMIAARDRAAERRAEALALVEEDAAAFSAVIAAYKLPKDTEADAAERTERIQLALAGAADVPRRTAVAAAEVLDLAASIVAGSNVNVVSDVAAAAASARAALAIAAVNIEINVGSIADPRLKESLAESVAPDRARADARRRDRRRRAGADRRVTLIDGRPLAAAIREQTAADVAELVAAGIAPKLAAVVATDDPATGWYVRSIAKAAAAVGIAMEEATVDAGDPAGVVERLGELSSSRPFPPARPAAPAPAPARDPHQAAPTAPARAGARKRASQNPLHQKARPRAHQTSAPKPFAPIPAAPAPALPPELPNRAARRRWMRQQRRLHRAPAAATRP